MASKKFFDVEPKAQSPMVGNPTNDGVVNSTEGGEGWISSTALKPTPFLLGRSQGRRYVRLELSSPIQFRLLACERGKLKLSQERISGEILNLSEGGVLLLTLCPIPVEGFVLLTLNLNGLVILEGVLGKIKRVEASGEGDFLVGLEFAPKEELERLSSPQEVKELPVKVASFNYKLREIITSYLQTVEFATKSG